MSTQPTDDDAIYPTHTCFDDAVNLLADVAAHAPLELDRYTLVHAICIFPEGGHTLRGRQAGELFGHAWVEKYSPSGTEVLQQGLWRGHRVTFALSLLELEKLLRPQRMWKYSAKQLLEDPVLANTPGPWERELLELSGAHVCTSADMAVGR